jgi:Protein of unknown function (DUF3667)
MWCGRVRRSAVNTPAPAEVVEQPRPLADDAAAPARCPNCGHALPDPRPRFCGHCGQETNLRPPRLLEFAQQFGGAYLSTEGALWRTLGLLLLRPGELTRRYLAGRRKHYVLPLRLYLTISLLTLLVLRLMIPTDVDMGAGTGPATRNLPNVTIKGLTPGAGAGLKDGVFYCEGMPAWLCKRLSQKLELEPKSFAREMQRLPERFVSHWGTTMFLLVPLFAALHLLLYRRTGLRYTEHLVHALHVHAFWFAALLLAMLPSGVVAGVMALIVPVYTLMAARRVYGGGWWQTVWKALIVGFLYSIVLSVALAAVAVWTFLS